MKIAVTSENKLKINAVEKAYLSIGIKPQIIGYTANSEVGEQPVNEQTLLGARNRIKSIKPKVENIDRIISIENGIFEENNKWLDKAVVILYNVKNDKEYIEYSDTVVFPNEYVKKARKIGFNKITVGKIMAEEGYVLNPKDPHKSISGISRQTYLENALIKIVKKAEKE